MLFGETLKDVASQLYDLCAVAVENYLEDEYVSLGKLILDPNQNLIGFLTLRENRDPSAEVLKAFTFSCGDATYNVIAIENGMDAFTDAFNEFAKDALYFDNWRLRQGIPENPLVLRFVNQEIRRISAGELFPAFYLE